MADPSSIRPGPKRVVINGAGESEDHALKDQILLDRYNRLFKSKGGLALVTVEHEVCTGCHMKVNTQTILEARGEKAIIACPQCGRFLYEPK